MTNTSLASAVTGMLLVQDMSYLLELLEEPEELSTQAARTVEALVAARDGPRAPPFSPAARTVPAAPAAPAPAHPTPQARTARPPAALPHAPAGSPRRSVSQEPRGFPLGFKAYRALAPSLQRPTLRVHLVWAVRAAGDLASEELIDALMARGPVSVCGCLSDPMRLRGAIRSHWRRQAPGASQPRGQSRASRPTRAWDQPARPAPYWSQDSWAASATPARPTYRARNPPAQQFHLSTSSNAQWRPSLTPHGRPEPAPPPGPPTQDPVSPAEEGPPPAAAPLWDTAAAPAEPPPAAEPPSAPRRASSSPAASSSTSQKPWRPRRPSRSPSSHGPRGKRRRAGRSSRHAGSASGQ